MHPIERLRYVARSGQGDPRAMVHETAAALRGLRLDPSGVILACRRIVERHPTCGPLWWLSAHLLVAVDPFDASRHLADYIVDDPTADRVVDALPEDCTVCVIGWPDLIADALARRGDVRSLVVDIDGEGEQLVRRLQRSEFDTTVVEPAGVAAAVEAADLVLLEPLAAGGEHLLSRLGSHAAAAVARVSGRPVWAVVPRGRCLPTALWAGMVQRWQTTGEPWERSVELVPWGLIDRVIGADGMTALAAPAAMVPRAECPDTPELLRSSAI
jgi:hypothetical protein